MNALRLALALLALAAPAWADYPSTILADSPVAYWRLDEASGTGNYVDAVAARNMNAASCGSSNDRVAGAIAESPSWGQSFDGSTDCGSVGDNNVFSPTNTNAFSAECWAKKTSGAYVLAKGNDGGPYEWAFGFSGGSVLLAQLFQSGGADYGLAFGGTSVSTGTWYHIAMTWASGGTLRIYLNGVQDGTDTTFAGSLSNTNSSTRLAYFNTNYFTGSIDECAVFNSELSSARVLAHYQAGLASSSVRRRIIISQHHERTERVLEVADPRRWFPLLRYGVGG